MSNIDEFRKFAEKLASIGRDGRGVTRLGLTQEDAQARKLLLQEWKTLGCDAYIDGIGNLVGTYGEPPFILIGSHTDTVPHGGNYDGILGVIAATVIVRHWDPSNGGLLLVDWSCEESSRFGLSTLGSHFAVGEIEGDMLNLSDASGMTVRSAADEFYDFSRAPIFRIGDYAIKACLELHIEQDNKLSQAGIPLGIVTAIAAPQRYTVTVNGQANHSGGTEMLSRRDALAAMAEIVLAVEALSKEHESHGLRSTVTTVSLSPGAANVIPGKVSGTIDIRAQNPNALNHYRTALQQSIAQISHTRNVSITLSPISEELPGNLNPTIIQCMEYTLSRAQMPYLKLPSWPSHDSLPLSRHLPTGMLFVRNPSGISHNTEEFIEETDIELALTAFRQCLMDLCKEVTLS